MHKESWMNWIWCNFVQIARSYIHNRVKSFLKGKFYFLGPLLCHKIFMKHLYIIGMKIGKINAVRYTYVWHMFQSIAGFPILLLYKVFKKNHTVLLKNFSQENYLWNACKSDSWLNLLQSLSLTAILVQCQPHLNHQTQPFWVKGIWLVPNSQTLAGFGIGALRLVTGGHLLILSHPTSGTAQTSLQAKNNFVIFSTKPLQYKLLRNGGKFKSRKASHSNLTI